MKLRNFLLAFSALLLMVNLAPNAWAEDDLDITITVVGEDDDPESAFELIALPLQASPTGVENSQKGIDTANAAREDGKAFGQATAEAAKTKGEEAKNNALNAADNASRQNQENIKDLVSSKIPDAAQDKIPADVLDRINNNRKPDKPPKAPDNPRNPNN